VEAVKVLILMGSKSDMPVMEKATGVFDEYAVASRTLVRSAHRTPEATVRAVKQAEEAGCEVFICGAGMAAHLAGVVAAHTVKPVIGVPIAAGPMDGQDALLSTVMMPPGIPVATVGINGAKNAALLAIQILATGDARLRQALLDAREKQANPED
jgi:5-(carboxyamino)imidazole ribonucleotide mutase